ncbi:hypothetical protein [Hymenobacter sp. 5414T-23]|uniref:hypothetical protein n=1 Tax=Hymenobacter sp. 5414T-23 TaxID=2932252 RepID=UPI001FD5C247|nr:hypothetical protein [Hymenobacter sp. 5414T-23]UOQ81179.1 hypothetical protein MUN83_20625 [Hymenobacter sp. 5414T-23]
MAQSESDFQAGSYVLEKDIAVRHAGLIRARNKNLRVKAEQEKTVAYPWAEVHSYRIGMARYIKASGFTIQTNFSTRQAADDFVQLLDSGALSLLRYEYAPTGGYVGINGAPSLGPSSRPDLYLLHRVGEATPIEIPYSVLDGSGKKFREAVAFYVAGRPDLVKLLAAKKITIYNLETFIHAFNTHEPFLNYPMEGGQSNP